MKLHRENIYPYFPLITIPTGWAALAFVIFSKPGLLSILDIFSTSPQGKLRNLGYLSLFSLAVLVVLILTTYSIDLFLNSGKYFGFLSPLKKKLNHEPTRRYWLVILLITSLVFLQLASSGKMENQLDELFFSSIKPLLVWGFLLTFLSFIKELFPVDNEKLVVDNFWKISGALFLLFFSAGQFLQLLGYGYTEQSKVLGNFELTGYPIVGYQVFFSSLAALFVSYLLGKVSQTTISKYLKRMKFVDVIICLILFITAVVVWKAFPIQPNMFYDQPRPPNFEYYPNSDSNLYDRTALNMLETGKMQSFVNVYDDYIGRRPYLAVYLAGLHRLTHSNYPEMISIQQVLFSLTPVFIYLLATSLHSRPAGVLAGLLILIREWNGLLLSDTVTGVHSQLMMSEIPTMIGLVVFLLVLNKAFMKKTNRSPQLLLAGGVLGITMLIRQEVGIVLPAIAIGMLLINRKKFANVAGQVTLLLAGMVIVITPWMIRNLNESGKLYLDVPGNRLNSIYRTLGIDKNWWKINQGDESQSGIMDDLSSSGKSGSIIPVTSSITDNDDLEPTRFEIIANHFTNQLVQTVAYLPNYPLYLDIDFISKGMIGKLDRYYGGVFYSPQKYVKTLPYWWTDWSGKIPVKSMVSVAVVVFLIASGISAAWKKDRSTALNPLLSYFGYIVIYSLVRASGGRFLQEIDWIALVYFSIGIMEVLSYLFRKQGDMNNPAFIDPPPEDKTHKGKPGRSLLVYSAVFIFLLTAGSLPVIIERSIPTSYPVSVLQIKTGEILQNPQSLLHADPQKELLEFLNSDGSAIFGRAYYPRYFDIGENLEDIRPVILGDKEDRYDYQRTEFYLIGSDTSWVLLKNESIPEVFPNGSEVYTIGCQQDGILDAVAVIIFGENGVAEHIYWRDDTILAPLNCPLQESGASIN